MKFKCILLGLVWMGLLMGPASAEDKTDFKDPEDAVSYSIGFQMGAEFRQYGVTVNPDVVAAGIREALTGAKPRLSETEMKAKVSDLQARVRKTKQEELTQQAARNLAEGEAFLAENAKNKKVVVLPSGLQYQVLQAGKGESPKPTDKVTVHYRGTFIDGKEFDSSYGRGKPASFRLDRVIKGWTEGVGLMKPGAKWKLYIPAKLAYGERNMGASIPANSTLIFEVELISIDENKSVNTGKGGKG